MANKVDLSNSLSAVPCIYGAASFSPERKFKTPEAANEVLDALIQANILHINTAQLYGQSEKTLGLLEAGTRFTIDTKAAGGAVPGALGRDEIVRRGKTSLENLGVTQVNIFYLHMPDDSIPIGQTLAGVQKLYQAGMFRQFGLSNYLAKDVEDVYNHCVSNGYVLPTVFQGSYNPICRRVEEELLPTLRRLNISFYAYAPQAGGFLAKSKEEVLEGKGRFDPNNRGGQMLRGLYCKTTLLESLKRWNDIATAAGCSRSHLACRWLRYHSALQPEHGDAIVFSSSTVDQTRDTIEGLNAGPLDDDAVNSIDEMWALVSGESPLDNING
jgi:aflatoxin B1 aldehyde reductase